MKRHLLLILALLMSLCLTAAPVSRTQAQQAAQRFLQQKGFSQTAATKLAIRKARQTAGSADEAYYYVFNVGQQNGFVVVSGDDRTDEILGYADQGELNTEDMPSNLRAWLEGYAEQIRWMDEHNYTLPALARTSHRPTKTPIAPLLQTKWNQNAPYNLMCPSNGYEHCYTGCVATATAQIIAYHRTAQTIRTIPAYTTATNRYRLKALPVTTFDFDIMKDAYDASATDLSDASNAAIATLMKYVGYAVQMDYDFKGSAAPSESVPIALVNYFGFDPDCYLATRNNYSYSEWINLIYDELSRGPVYYSGSSTDSGHAFVCDGYAENDYFHINWGWGGKSDGYFKLSLLDVSDQGIGGNMAGYGYGFNQDALVNVRPTDDGISELVQAVRMNTFDFTVEEKGATRASTSDYFAIHTNESLRNWTGNTYTFDFAYGLYQDDELIGIIAEYAAGIEVKDGWGWDSWSWELRFGHNIANGIYRIVPMSREHGTTTYYPSANSEFHYIEAVISGYQLSLSIKNDTRIAGTLQVMGNTIVGKPIKLKASLINNGSLYSGDIYIISQKIVQGQQTNLAAETGMYVELAANGQDDYYLEFTPRQTGDFKLWLCNKVFGAIADSVVVHVVENSASATNKSLELNSVILLNAESDGTTVYGKTAHFTASIKNNSNLDFNDGVFVVLADYTASYYTDYKYVDAVIASGASTTITFSFDELSYGHNYAIYFFDYGSDSYYYPFCPTQGIDVYLADGSTSINKPTTSFTVPDDAVAVDFTGAVGNIIVTPNTNPNALYYFTATTTIPTSLNDRNVVKGGQIEQLNLTDGYPFSVPVSFTAHQTVYKRTFDLGVAATDGWTTLMLPFDVQTITASDRTLDWFRSSTDSGKQFWLKTFSYDTASGIVFDDATQLQANIPYLIGIPGSKWGEQMNLTGQPITFSAAQTNYVANSFGGTTGDYFKFNGYTVGSTVDNAYVLNAKGDSFVKTDNAAVQPFRGVFFTTVTNADSPVNQLPVGINLKPTAIWQPSHINAQASPLYDLEGRRLNAHPKKGLYIRNHQKVLVK